MRGEADPSPAGPVEQAGDARLPEPPQVTQPRLLQNLQFSQRQVPFLLRARSALGDVFQMRGSGSEPGTVVVNHPDHVRSLFRADPEQVPTFAGAQLEQVVGPNSILTSIGPRHMQQRRLLLPQFHGEAIELFNQVIIDATEREIDTWPVGHSFPLVPRLQTITLDVIFAGIFGIWGTPEPGSAEHQLRIALERMVSASTRPFAQLYGLFNRRRGKPSRLTRMALSVVDRPIYALIQERRRAEDLTNRRDILSLLLQTRVEQAGLMTDSEVRDELLSLLLAGHETTANSLAWTWERLLRHPGAYNRLRDSSRARTSKPWIDAVIMEGMRCRPVIPIIGRTVQSPWRLGRHGVPASTSVLISIILLHHREDLYPRPFEFRPERWLERKPGTYEWVPFGGGVRRCIGAALAMTEQRIVLEAMARRLDLATEDHAPEHARHRNVTMIPSRGARAVVRIRYRSS
jgi:cytochrome P450